MKRRTKQLLLLLACMLCMPFVLPGAQASVPVRVGFFEFDGYHMQSDDGARSGYGYEVLQRMGRYTDWKYEYIGYKQGWSDMLDMLRNGEIDLLTSAQKTPEREKLFDFSERSIGTSTTILTVKAGNDTYSAGDYLSYDGMHVGMLTGNSRNDSFDQFAKEKKFSYIPVYFENQEELAQALQDGKRIDTAVSSNLRVTANEWILDQFDASEFYVLVKKGNTKLLAQVNNALAQMDTYDPGWETQLFHSYYSADGSSVSGYSAAERAYLHQLKDSKTPLRVLVNPDREPYSYFENGEAKGIIPTLFTKVARQLGFAYEIVPVSNQAEYAEQMKSGAVDVYMDAVFDYDSAEKRGYKLTSPYLTTTVTRVTPRNLSQKILHAAALRDDIGSQAIAKRYGLREYDCVKDCVQSVLDGSSDAAYLYTYIAQKVVAEDVRNQLETNLVPDETVRFALGVSENQDTRLLSVLDKAVKSMDSSLAQSVVMEYTQDVAETISPIAYLYDQPLVAMGIGLVVLLVLAIAAIAPIQLRNVKRTRQNAAELERFIGYVCRSNDAVLEMDLSQSQCIRYEIRDGHVVQVAQRLPHGDAETIHPEDFPYVSKRAGAAEVQNMIDRGESAYFECRVKQESGAYQWNAYTLQGIPCDRKHPNNLMVFRKNIDDVKQEEERKRKALVDALETATHASRAKGEFLSHMSHEMRTPLNAVIGYMTLAEMAHGDTERMEHCLHSGTKAARHLLGIINDILDLSSIESGRMKLASERFDLKQMLMTLSDLFYHQAEKKGVQFSIAVKELTEEWVIGDPMRVNQILMNLLSNAIKFTSDGSIALLVEQSKCADGQVHIRFQVKDTGIGMSKDYMQRLFTPFEQESAGTAQKFGGTGLGLSITKNLVSMMGGTINAASEVGKGSTFTVMLPFRCAEQEACVEGTQQDFSHVRALLVENDPNAYLYLKTLFDRCGVQNDTVPDSDAAVRQVAQSSAYDLCVLDWDMNLDCAKMVECLRQACKKPPIFIAAAYDAAGIEETARQAGVDRVIAKPLFQSTIFDLLVNTYLGRAAKEQTVEDSYDLSGRRILLVEDNEMNREIALYLLEQIHLDVDCAVNGQDAVEQFSKAKPGTYQAILMDIQMPVMDGYQATRCIRALRHPQALSIPIIAMTANAFAEDIARALSAGMNEHIAKPVDYHKLYAILERFVGRNEP